MICIFNACMFVYIAAFTSLLLGHGSVNVAHLVLFYVNT